MWAACWYAHQREREALRHLSRAKIEVWLPRVRRPRVVHGRRRDELRPLFPSYLFVIIEQAHHALWKPSVLRPLVESGASVPARIPTHLIEELRCRERDGAIEFDQPPPWPLSVGDRVLIREGPLNGRSSEIAELARDRVAVLLAALGRVNLPTSAVEVIGCRSAVAELRARLDQLAA